MNEERKIRENLLTEHYLTEYQWGKVQKRIEELENVKQK